MIRSKEYDRKYRGNCCHVSRFYFQCTKPTRTERFPLTREINRVELAAPSGFQESGSPE